MPVWLRRFLRAKDLNTHLKYALGIGLVLRLCSAFFVYGPQALDDYKHGVWPAYQFFSGIPLDIPQYRSHLLVWLLAFFVKCGSVFGVESALGQVRAMYLGLACLSLTGIWGSYFYVRNFKSRIFSALTLYLVAAFPLMPFVSTRAFGEAIALNLVLLSMGLLESARALSSVQTRFLTVASGWLAGFMVMGLAVCFRYHVGLIFVVYGLSLLYLRIWSGVLVAVVAGLFTILAQVVIDVLSGKPPMGTLLVYLAENEGGATKYGVSPWYNPLLFILVISLAPFSFVFWRSLKSLWVRHKYVVLPFLVFLVAHCLVAHKEERFLYPIVGLELWFLSFLWASSALNSWSRKVYSSVLLGVVALLLPVVCFINTQEGEIEPPALIEQKYKNVVYLDFESLFGMSRFKFYFLRPPSRQISVLPQDFSATMVDQLLAEDIQVNAVVMLTSNPDAKINLEAMAGINTLDSKCLALNSSGSIVDRALYSMNPKHNQRRRPTWYVVCERMSHG